MDTIAYCSNLRCNRCTLCIDNPAHNNHDTNLNAKRTATQNRGADGGGDVVSLNCAARRNNHAAKRPNA